MKHIIIILLLVAGIHLTIISKSKASALGVEQTHKAVKISPGQQKELGRLVNLYKQQAKKHCDLCQLGTQTEYTHRTNAEFQYLVRQSQQKLNKTIHALKNLYERMGMKHQQIADKEKELRLIFYYWK